MFIIIPFVMGQVAFYNKTFWVLSSLSLSPFVFLFLFFGRDIPSSNTQKVIIQKGKKKRRKKKEEKEKKKEE